MSKKVSTILGTVGLLIAIYFVLNSIFDIGKISFKSLTSKLPLLKCEIYDPNAKNEFKIYDLKQIKKDDPTTNMNKKELVEWRSRENLEEVTFRNDEKRNEYKIRWESHDNGINKGYFVLIKKDTGELEMWFPTQVSIKASSQVSIQSYVDAKVFKGECVKIKRKNL